MSSSAERLRTNIVANMFPVPGWSVSADVLETQADPASKTLKEVNPNGGKEKPSKKRKRGGGEPPNGIQITGDNLAEFWEEYIEGKTKREVKRPDKKDMEQLEKKKKRKKHKLEESERIKSTGEQAVGSESREHPPGDDEVGTVQEDVQERQDSVRAEIANEVAKTPKSKGAAKAEYETRMRKKREKALLRASGELPPPRPAQLAKAAEVHPVSKAEAPLKDLISDASMVKPNKKGERSSSPVDIPWEKLGKESTAHNDPKQDKPMNLNSETTPRSAPSKPKAKAPIQNPFPVEHPKKTPEPPSLPIASFPLPPVPPKALPLTSKLTPLQSKMQSKLLSARFRHLNQTLYTTPSSQASALFTSTPSAYASYHAGFRAQVAVWPQNPVETFIADVKARGGMKREGLGAQKNAWRQEKRGRGKKNSKAAIGDSENKDIEPLPRTKGICTIADLGCGDATLAGALLSSAGPKNLNLKFHSFDLSKGDGPNANLVTVADITALPLKAGEVDVAVLCLSLMGTNWVSCVDEVSRAVRWGGEAWVAEIKSRFARVGKKGEGGIGGTKSGNEKDGKKRKRGAGDDGQDEREGGEEVVEVDSDPDILALGKGGKDRKRVEDETDVSAFVEVWRRRGFELKGEVDLANKMFVRMRFVKRGAPKESEPSAGRYQMKGKVGAKTKFVDGETSEDVVGDEAKVLKPCVYKLR